MTTNKEAIESALNKPIELAKTLQRLFQTDDFKAIYEAYTKDFLASTVINIGRTGNPNIKAELHAKVDSIADFIKFLDEIATDGQNAAEHLRQLQEEELNDEETE